MTTIRRSEERRNFVLCSLRILVVPSLSPGEMHRILDLLNQARDPGRLTQDLAEYLWEHYLGELVVQGRDELELAIERIATAFATLDEEDRCAATPPLLWLDVSQPAGSYGRRLQ